MQVVILLLIVIVGVAFFVAYRQKKLKQEEEQNGRRNAKASTRGKGGKTNARYSPLAMAVLLLYFLWYFSFWLSHAHLLLSS